MPSRSLASSRRPRRGASPAPKRSPVRTRGRSRGVSARHAVDESSEEEEADVNGSPASLPPAVDNAESEASTSDTDDDENLLAYGVPSKGPCGSIERGCMKPCSRATTSPLRRWVIGADWAIGPAMFFFFFAMFVPFLLQYWISAHGDTEDFLDWFHKADQLGKDTIPQFFTAAIVVFFLHQNRPWLMGFYAGFGVLMVRGKWYISCFKRWNTTGLCHPWEESWANTPTVPNLIDYLLIWSAVISLILVEGHRFKQSVSTRVAWIFAALFLGPLSTFPLWFISFIHLERTVRSSDRNPVSWLVRWWYAGVVFTASVFYYHYIWGLMHQADADGRLQSFPYRDFAEHNKTLWYNSYTFRASETITGSYMLLNNFSFFFVFLAVFVAGVDVKPRRGVAASDFVAKAASVVARMFLVWTQSFFLGACIYLWFFVREMAPGQRLCGAPIEAEISFGNDREPAAQPVPPPAEAGFVKKLLIRAWSFLKAALYTMRPCWRTLPNYLFLGGALAIKFLHRPKYGGFLFAGGLLSWLGPQLYRALDIQFKILFKPADRDIADMCRRQQVTTLMPVILTVWIFKWHTIYGLLGIVAAYGIEYVCTSATQSDKFKRAFAASSKLVPRLHLPILVAYHWWDIFIGFSANKYGNLIAADIFRQLTEYAQPAPLLLIAFWGFGFLGLQTIRWTLLPPHSTKPGRVSAAVKLAGLVLLAITANAVRHAWNQEVCKLNPGHEYHDPANFEDVSSDIHELIDMNTRVQGCPFASRAQHAKTLGCLTATFEVLPEINPRYQEGVFQPGRTYDAYVRFSNGHTRIAPDTKPDARGMAIKLIGAEGERADGGPLDEENTQDFIMLTSPIFFAGSTEGYVEVIRAATSPDQMRDVISWILPNWIVDTSKVDIIKRMKAMAKSGDIQQLLKVDYFSTTPYRLGTGEDAPAVKYSVRPCELYPSDPKLDEEDAEAFEAAYDDHLGGRGHNYLREALSRRLAHEDACFEFLIQEQSRNACVDKVEDPTVPWKGASTVVARLTIPKQEVPLLDKMGVCENLAFHPWHALEAHRPLGEINAARKPAYQASAAYRLEKNNVAPTAKVEFETEFSGPYINGDALALSKRLHDYEFTDIHPCCPGMPRTVYPVPAEQALPIGKQIMIAQDFLGSILHYVRDFFTEHGEFATGGSLDHPDEYTKWFDSGPAFGIPFTESRAAAEHWKEDAFFARQYLSGIHPVMIRTVDSVSSLTGPGLFSEEDIGEIDQYLKTVSGSHSVAGLAAKGYLYVADYERMKDIDVVPGRYMYCSAVLFYMPSMDEDAVLLPLAINLTPRVAGGLHLPNEKEEAWVFAKMHVAQADSVWHESVTHFGGTHLVVSGAIIAFNRHLRTIGEDGHPLFQMMDIHFAQTLSLTAFAMDTLIKANDPRTESFALGGLVNKQPSGVIDSMAVGLIGVMELIARANDEETGTYNMSQTFPEELASRGFTQDVLDNKIKGYYFATDGMQVWEATEKYAASVVDLLYKTDADVRTDADLQRMANDLGPSGARVRGAPTKFKTKDELKRFLAIIVYTSTALHTQVNYPQVAWMGFIPNRPYQITKPMPYDRNAVTWKYIAESLPHEFEDVVKFIATNHLLSMPTDLPLAEVEMSKDHTDSRIIEKFEEYKKSLAHVGVDNPEIDGIKYDVLSPVNLASTIAL